jgi:hypothetical protein
MLAERAARDEQPILPISTNTCITRAAGTQRVNPLSAMVAIWHHIIVSLQVLAQKGFIEMLIYLRKCIRGSLGQRVVDVGLVDVG